MNIHKFNWAEMFNNSKGKTSAGTVAGFIACFSASIVFLVCGFSVVSKYNEGPNVQSLAMQSVLLFTAGAGLLGIRRFTKDKEIQVANTEEKG